MNLISAVYECLDVCVYASFERAHKFNSNFYFIFLVLRL